MARDLSTTEPAGDDDALALFGAEVGADARAAGNGPVLGTTSSVVSLEDISKTSTLRFVEGVAVVQALTTAIKAKGGVSAGMPDLQGVFLTPAGEVVAMSPPGGEPAAPELARLLHRMVPADVTPPVGRLFIDRWASGESNDLTQFASEIEYFARPNGRELLATVHARFAPSAETPSNTAGPAAAVVPPVPAPEVFRPPTPRHEAEVARPEKKSLRAWVHEHRRQLAAATVIIVSTVLVTALGSWFWPTRTAAAATGPAASGPVPAEPIEATAAPKRDRATPPSKRPAAKASLTQGVRNPIQPRRADATQPGRAEETRPENQGTAAGAPAQPSNASTVEEAPAPVLQSRNGPDMRIYSGNDPGVEAPTLRSADIPELLISGFPARTNFVELVVSPEGEVETVKMVGPPQRMPDIMLLSRVKEWAFLPATKDGRAVRYRLTLSWNVTP